ncbi:MAG: FIST N-terminal domain-containing protein [Microcoleaceae cyanobacterium]
MQWVNVLSMRPSLEAAVAEVVVEAQQALSGQPDLAIVFISSAFASEYSRLVPLLQEHLQVPALVGCGGGGIIGMNPQDNQPEEIEGQPALSLYLAHLPEVKVKTFHLTAQELPDMDSSPTDWVDLIGVDPQDNPQFVLLIDPMCGQINDFLQGLDYAYPGATKVGGLASNGIIDNPTTVFCDDQAYPASIVGVALSGNILIETIVAQGCRPVGPLYRVTKGDRNVILEVEQDSTTQELQSGTVTTLQGASPLEALQDLIQGLDETDRQLAQNSLFIGVVRDEFKQSLGQGDFLIRNLLGVDPRVGAIAIGDRVRPGQRIQFHLRDARTSKEDLELLLQRYSMENSAPGSGQSIGALMFSCLGRGAALYGEPNFDSALFSRYLNVPLGGFFCNGEIGPVGDETFLHGYTSVFGICRQLS